MPKATTSTSAAGIAFPLLSLTTPVSSPETAGIGGRTGMTIACTARAGAADAVAAVGARGVDFVGVFVAVLAVVLVGVGDGAFAAVGLTAVGAFAAGCAPCC